MKTQKDIRYIWNQVVTSVEDRFGRTVGCYIGDCRDRLCSRQLQDFIDDKLYLLINNQIEIQTKEKIRNIVQDQL